VKCKRHKNKLIATLVLHCSMLSLKNLKVGILNSTFTLWLFCITFMRVDDIQLRRLGKDNLGLVNMLF